MSYWEQNWRMNLKLITLDETPQAQQIQVSSWLKVRCEYLLGSINYLEAECLIQEFDDVKESWGTTSKPWAGICSQTSWSLVPSGSMHLTSLISKIFFICLVQALFFGWSLIGRRRGGDMDWLEGLGWAGVVSVGVSFLWDLFLPLNLIVIAALYISTFLVWLCLAREVRWIKRSEPLRQQSLLVVLQSFWQE